MISRNLSFFVAVTLIMLIIFFAAFSVFEDSEQSDVSVQSTGQTCSGSCVDWGPGEYPDGTYCLGDPRFGNDSDGIPFVDKCFNCQNGQFTEVSRSQCDHCWSNAETGQWQRYESGEGFTVSDGSYAGEWSCDSGRWFNTNTCRPIDVNYDGELSLIDFTSFAFVYRTQCLNDDLSTFGCGSSDSDQNGTVDIADFTEFAANYQQSCI